MAQTHVLTYRQRHEQLARILSFLALLKADVSQPATCPGHGADLVDGKCPDCAIDSADELNANLVDICGGSMQSLWDKETTERQLARLSVIKAERE